MLKAQWSISLKFPAVSVSKNLRVAVSLQWFPVELSGLPAVLYGSPCRWIHCPTFLDRNQTSWILFPLYGRSWRINWHGRQDFRSGYLQRCLIKHLETLRVHYDHTVVPMIIPSFNSVTVRMVWTLLNRPPLDLISSILCTKLFILAASVSTAKGPATFGCRPVHP